MNSFTRLSLLLLAACATFAGCSKQPSAGLVPVIAPASPCETLVLKAADFGGLLQAPITHATALAGDGQSCAFLTTGFSAITVSVRPGLGRASLDAWSAGKMQLEDTVRYTAAAEMSKPSGPRWPGCSRSTTTLPGLPRSVRAIR